MSPGEDFLFFLEDGYNVFHSLTEVGVKGYFWKGNGRGEPFKGDIVSGGVGFGEVEFIAAVLF